MATNETIIKIKKRVNPYTMIDSSIFTDDRLSWKAKGLLGYFLSRPDDWKINIKDLYKQSTDGYDSIKSGLKDLKENGYLEHVPVKFNGKIVSWEYVVHEVPIEAKPKALENSPREGFPLVENPPEENPLEGNPPEEKPPEGNPPHTNNDITNNYNTNNDFKDFDMTDRNYIIKRAREEVVAKCKLDLFEPQIAQTLDEAIKGLFYDDKFASEKLKMPIETVRESLKILNFHILESAVLKMLRAIQSGTVINSSKHYLMSCIFNSIGEYTAERIINPVSPKNSVRKPKKTIFEIVKGSEFEEPVNILAKEFSNITFNSFFRETISSLDRNGNILNIQVNDPFVADTLTEKHKKKILGCFERIGIQDVVFSSPSNCFSA